MASSSHDSILSTDGSLSAPFVSAPQPSAPQLLAAVHAGQICLWSVDLLTRELWWDEGMSETFGIHQVSGVCPREAFEALIHPEDLARVRRLQMEAIERRQVPPATFRMFHPDGSLRHVRVSGSVSSNAEGNPVRLNGILQDITEQVRAEEALKEERDLFSEGPVFTVIWDPGVNWPVRHVSKNVEQILGYTVEQLTSGQLLYADLIHPDDLERIADEVNTHFQSGAITFEQSYRLKHRNGSYRWFHDSTRLLRDPSGTVIEIRGYLVDQTEYRESQLEAEAQRRRLANVIQATGVGTWEWNVQTGETVFNERWAELIGYSLEELQPVSIETWQRFANPDDLLASAENLERHFRGEAEFYDVQCRMKHRDGHWIWVHDRGRVVTRTADGSPEWMFGTHTDISERKQTEERVRKSESRFRDIADSMADWIWETDPQGCITFSSGQVGKILGYTPEELQGRTLFDFLCPESLEESAESLQQHLLHERPFRNAEYWCVTREGKRICLLISGVPLYDETGFPEGFRGVCNDISSLKQAEDQIRIARDDARNKAQQLKDIALELEMKNEELDLALARAEEANRLKSQFIANTSHEIRTPMNGVIGMTSLLQETDLDPDQQDFCNTISSSAEALLDLINDILDFSKIEAGRMDLEQIEFSLRNTIEEMGDMLALKAHEKGIEYTQLIEKGVPAGVVGDPGRLRQVLINLVNNAIKFTEQGEVAVRVLPLKESDTDVSLRFEVQDSGIGIAREKQAALFQAFTQADGSTTRKFGGTGLGLSISKRLAGLMQGEIGVESEEGKGATFWFTATFGRITKSEAAPTDASGLAGKRVLVADANPTSRRVLRLFLESWGCEMLESDDCNTALAALERCAKKKRPVDLVLADLQLPGCGGTPLAEHIRKDASPGAPALAALASFGKKGDAEMARAIGYSAYLTKPVKQEQLLRSCRAVLCGPAARAAETVSRVTRRPVEELDARILLADDNLVNQKVAAMMLRKLGCRVATVSDGKEALTEVQRQPFDLVLMDCQMPEMDGYEATRRIKALGGEYADLPVIALTAAAMKEDRQRCMDAGMDDYLTKPVDMKKLGEMILLHVRQGDKEPLAG